MAEIFPMLLITLLLHLCWVPSGLCEWDEEIDLEDAEEDDSFGGTFSLEDYTSWLKKHKIHLLNYVAEVNETVILWSPILPVPKGLHWTSLNMESELPASASQKLGMSYSHYFEKFLKTYNVSWPRVFFFDRNNRHLRIEQINLGYADVYRLHVAEDKNDNGRKKTSSVEQDFDVAITLMTYKNHECEFKSRPQNPKLDDTLILSCSVIVHGYWNGSLVFRNSYDGSKIKGEVSKCSRQPSVGSAICSTIKVKAETNILAYTCNLEFPPQQRLNPGNPMFQNSKWTARFNKEIICYFPVIYMEAIPSDVEILCNNMPCVDSVEVNDTISCVAEGYPQPVFDLRITKDSSAATNNRKESEELRQAFEHVKEIEKYLEKGGIVNRVSQTTVLMLLRSILNESSYLEKLGNSEGVALGKDEEANTTLDAMQRRNISEMINIILKNLHAFSRYLDGTSTPTAPENGTTPQEIVWIDLSQATDALQSKIRDVSDRLLKIYDDNESDIDLANLRKLNGAVMALLSILDLVKKAITTAPPVQKGGKAIFLEDSEEVQNQLIDGASAMIDEFKYAYENDMVEEAKQIYYGFLFTYELPDLESNDLAFMDSHDDPDPDGTTSSETLHSDKTTNLSEGTLSTSETNSPSYPEEIAASTERSPTSYRDSSNDTVSDSAAVKDGAVVTDNTTETGYTKEVNATELVSSRNDIETTESLSTTGLPQLTSEEGIAGEKTTSEGISDASDSNRVKKTTSEGISDASYSSKVKKTTSEGISDASYSSKVKKTTSEGISDASESSKVTPDPEARETESGRGNENEKLTRERPTKQPVTSAESERDSRKPGTAEQAFKSVEQYRVQAKDIGHIEFSCNVSNALGWGYNTMSLVVSPQKPVLSTTRPTQRDKYKHTTRQFETEPEVESVKTSLEHELEPTESAESDIKSVGPRKEVTKKPTVLASLGTELRHSELTKRPTGFSFVEKQETDDQKKSKLVEDAQARCVTMDAGRAQEDKTTRAPMEAGAAAGKLFAEENGKGRAGGSLTPTPVGLPAARPAGFDAAKDTRCTADCNIRSVFLELFLVVFGVFLAQVEL